MLKAIVTDIEGTTSSLSFVKDVLFPYARANIGPFIRSRLNEPEVAGLLNEARNQAGETLDTEALIARMIRWIDEDKKITPLKSLQGLIWENGYRKGDFKGHVYPDASEALRDWKAKGIDLYVYSSGSVYAQKLLFGHSDFGDMEPLFKGYFDTHIGGKKETASYIRIAAAINLQANTILFLSDITEELDAARAAGFNTCRLVRDQPLTGHVDHPTVSSFSEIKITDYK